MIATRFGLRVFDRFRPRTIRSKVVALFATFVGLIALFIFLWVPTRLEEQALAALRDKAQSVATITAFSVRSAVVFDDRPAMKAALTGALEIPDLSYSAVTDTAGKVLAVVATEQLADGAAHETEDAPLMDRIHRVSTPVEFNGDQLGTVHIGISLQEITSARRAALEVGAVVSLLTFIIGMAVVAIVSVFVTAPLRRMVGTAERIAEGDLSQRVRASSKDEVGQLAGAFNTMITRVESAHIELQGANEDLEIRVAHRTKRLQEEIGERKQAEAWMRTLLDYAPEAIVILDETGHFIDANEVAERFYGLDRATLLQVGPAEVSPPTQPDGRPSAEVAAEKIAEALAGGTPRFEWAHRSEEYDAEVHLVRLPATGRDLVRASVLDITARKQAEEERKRDAETLERSEARYRSLVDHATYGIYRANAKGRFVSVNPALVGMLGYDSADEMLDLDLVHDVYVDPNERAILLERFRDAKIATGVDIQWARKDGRPVTVRVSARMFHNDAGELVGTEGFVEDVTERVRAERGLRDSEERLKVLFETAPDAYYLQDLEGWLVEGNPAAERLTGYSRSELMGKNFLQLQLLPAEQLPKVHRLLARSAAGEPTGPDEFTITRRDGSSVEAEIRSYPVRIKDRHLVLVNGRDVTERKRAEAAVREHEEMIRALVETSQDWIWAIDKQGFHTYCNPAVETILGYQPEEMVGHQSLQYLHEDDRRAVEAMLPAWVTEKKGWSNTMLRWRHKDGGYRYLESTAVPILDVHDELLGFRGVDRDVTERKTLEDQLRQAQKMEAVGQLTGGIAHDFNNLLSVIMMNLELTRHGLEHGEHVSVNDLRDAESAARKASVMTKQLLGFSRRAELTFSPTDLAKVLAGFTGMLRRVFPENIEVEVLHGDVSSAVLADKGAVEQILLNLATNARDAMPQGGRLSIELGETELDTTYEASHPWLRAGRFVTISISDTGIGMTEETKRRLFEPFYTTKPVGKGTGLGMAMVYGLIKQQKGFVNLYSELGEGTTFRLYFPAHSDAQKTPAEQTRPELRGGSETILLVEDEESLRRAAQRVLSQQGYNVITAADGKDALAIYQQDGDNIDLIVSDAVMPRMGGAELFQHILHEASDTKVLLVSGYTGREAHARSGLKHQVPFLQKPWTLAELLQRIRELLDGGPMDASQRQGRSERRGSETDDRDSVGGFHPRRRRNDRW